MYKKGGEKLKQLEKLFQENDIEYELIYHEKKICSSQEGAEYFSIDIGQTAPTLIISTDKGFFAVIISGKRKKLEFEIIEELLGCKEIRMATRKEVEEVTGYSVGSVPLVNRSIESIVDKQLLKYSKIYGGTGNANVTLKVSPNSLIKLNRIIGLIE